MSPQDELSAIAERLDVASRRPEYLKAKPVIDELLAVSDRAAAAFSGSWLGYHASVYYEGLRPPPPGARFSQERGLQPMYSSSPTRGDWVEYDRLQLLENLKEKAGKYSYAALEKAGTETASVLNIEKDNVRSIMTATGLPGTDTFVDKLLKELDNARALSRSQIEAIMRPSGQFISSDMQAIGAGVQVPPHVSLRALAMAYQFPFTACADASRICRTLSSHVERLDKKDRRMARIGTNVFLGHGRSKDWRELKDFVVERLRLPADEFNRVPVAGVTNIARLQEMLDSAAIAFVIMTAEDETKDGAIQARQNVIHEVGLFQGRLGFDRAIVVLEEGCSEFSNIQGLGQIRYPAGRISAAFEEVRQVCERAGLVDP